MTDEASSKRIKSNFLSLEFTSGVFEPRYGDIPRIYVRQCYEELYDISVANMLDPRNNYMMTLFTGVPGIGKSLFLFYFLYRFTTDLRFKDDPFALEFSQGRYYYFERTNTSGEFLLSIRNQDSLSPHKTLVLSDINDIDEPRCRSKWGFIFSSPNPARYKEIIKNSPRYTYTMPTWSEEELEYLDSNKSNWYDIFVRFGGVPRHVMWNGKDDNPELSLKQAIDDKGGTIASYFFKYGHGNIDLTKSYMLVHVNPERDQSLNQWMYQGFGVHSFASDYIFQSIIKIELGSMLAQAKNIFNAGVASETFGAVSAGHLFEKVCLWLYPLTGLRTCITLEGDNTTLTIEIPERDDILAGSIKDYSKKGYSGEYLTNNIFYKPRISNLTAGDAFFVITDSSPLTPEKNLMLVIIQITVAKMHPVKFHGLEEIYNSFNQEVQNRVGNVILLFVTPINGRLASKQNLTTKENTSRQEQTIPIALRNIRQYVHEYEL